MVKTGLKIPKRMRTSKTGQVKLKQQKQSARDERKLVRTQARADVARIRAAARGQAHIEKVKGKAKANVERQKHAGEIAKHTSRAAIIDGGLVAGASMAANTLSIADTLMNGSAPNVTIELDKSGIETPLEIKDVKLVKPDVMPDGSLSD